MKASEVLKRYAEGRKDFPLENLRGQSFKGKDLSGADFSGADIRSADFTNAILIGANFSHAQAGLQKRWATFLVCVSLLLSGILGLFSIFTGLLIALIFDGSSQVNQFTGWIVLIVIIVVFLVILRQGLNSAGAVAFAGGGAGAVAFAVAGGGAGAVAFLFAGAFTGAFAVTVAFAGAFTGAVAFAGAFAVAGARAFAVVGAVAVSIAVSRAGAVAGAKAVAGVKAFAVAFLFAGAFAGALLSAFIALQAMKGDKKYSLIRNVAVAFAAIGGTSFRNANLTNANFTGARLKSTDLRGAILTRVRWYGAKKLDRVRPGDTYLKNTQIRQWLLGKGTEKNFDGQKLQGINLQGADLTDASFIDVNLSEANLQDADLSRAKLVRTQLDKTDFTGATLTGACLEDWNINSTTNLDRVICDYVYLKEGEQERRPHDHNKNFAPGEFTKLFKKALETVDLVFSDGIDWKAFLLSFQELIDEYGEENILIQAIEKKSETFVENKTFVVRLEVPPEANKGVIESHAKELYETYRKALEAKYRAELQAKDNEIEIYKQHNTDLLELAKLASSRPINVEAKAMAENQSSSETFNTDLREANVANYASKLQDNARQQANQHNYAPEQKQTLAEAAEEIQQLLNQLQSQGFSQEEAQQRAANDLANKAKNNHTTKEKLVQWGQSLGDTAAQTTVSEAAKEVVKLALKFSGVLLP